MKCLSLKQPYAELIVSGKKTIELRKWNTKFRGVFLVHASKKTDLDSCRRFKIDPNSLTNGAILGQVCIYKVKKYKNKKEFLKDGKRHLATYKEYGKSRYAFLLENPRRLKKQIKIRGMLNFFNVADEIGVIHG